MNTRTQSKTTKWTLLAIALVMVGAVAIVQMPAAEAHDLDAHHVWPPSGGVNEFTIGSRQPLRVLELDLVNPYNEHLVGLEFSIAWLDDNGRRRMDFSPGHSGSFGWTAEADNQKGPTVPNRLWLNATADEHYLLSGAGGGTEPRTFYIGIIPVGNPTVDQNGDHCLYLNYTPIFESGPGETHYIGQQGAPTLPPKFCIDRKEPEILPGGAMTLDRDRDGYLDAMLVTFDERLDQSTFDRNQFTVRGYEIIGAQFRQPTATNPDLVKWVEYPFGLYLPTYPWYGDCPDQSPRASRPNDVKGCSQILFELQEKRSYDTGARPELRVGSGSLKDLAGNDIKRRSPVTVDGAPPILTSAVPRNTDENMNDYEIITLIFSENVQYSDRTTVGGDFYHPEGGCVDGAPAGPPGCGGTSFQRPTVRNVPAVFEYFELDADLGNVQRSGTGAPEVQVIHHPALQAERKDYHTMDLVLKDDAKLLAADIAEDSGDKIACGVPTHHLRDWGNGGDYYTGGSVKGETSESPALDPHRLGSSTNGHGLQCESGFENSVGIRKVSLVEVETNIWWDHAIVRFSAGVMGFDPEEQDEKTPIALGSLDIVTTNGGGPKGIVRIEHTACEHTAVVYFAQGEKVLPTDVDLTPSAIRAVPDQIRACDTGLDPENPFDNPQFVAPKDVALRDNIAPYIVTADTMDQDKNGVVDGYFLTWSEPIHDQSFCHKSVTCPGGTGDIQLSDPARFLNHEWVRYGPFTFDTDRLVNDDQSIIKWPEGYTDASGVFQPQGPRHPSAIHSGRVPNLHLAGEMVSDMVIGQPVNENLPLLAANAIPVRDRAPPVVWLAETVDSELDFSISQNEDCQLGGVDRCDPDPDGLLDGYRLTFSERVDDFFQFDNKDWHVEGYQVLPFDEDLHLERRVGDVFFDDVMLLRINERPETNGDTGETPELTYKATFEREPGHPEGRDDPDEPGPFRDLVGNLMLDFGAIAVDEVDDARPAIVRIEGFTGNNNLTIHFSEPVDDGTGEAVVRADLTYQNLNGQQGGVSGFAISDRAEPNEIDPFEVQHVAGGRKAVVPLNGNLTAGDISTDKILVKADSIRETAPGVADKKFVVSKAKALNVAPDITPPCGIKDLAFDLRGADFLRLTWIAPADDCTPSGNDLGGAVAGYVVKLNATAFVAFNATTNLLPDEDITLEFEPATMAEAGQTQTVTIVGLDPEKEYFAAVRAFDDAGNHGPPGTGDNTLVAKGTTLTDPTGPEGTLTITSGTHPEGQPTLERIGSFTWTGLEDPESVRIEYRYRLNQDPDYQVVRSDTSAGTTDTLSSLEIPSDGDWYLHVRGYSAGGPAKATAHYHVVVGAVPLSPEAMAECNAEINANLRAVHKDGVNRLNWTLPDCVEDLGSNSPLVSLYIWRIDSGVDFFRALDVREGSFSDLREGEYVDPTDSQTKNSRYFLQAEFARGLDANAEGQRASDPTLADRESAVKPVNQDPGTVPAWIWILLGVAMALIIAGLVIFFVLRHKDREDDATLAAGYQWEEIGGGPSGIDEASGLPIHDIQCPSCSTRFQAVGRTPLEVTCPNCRIGGTLD